MVKGIRVQMIAMLAIGGLIGYAIASRSAGRGRSIRGGLLDGSQVQERVARNVRRAGTGRPVGPS
jgi:hypothetical protein